LCLRFLSASVARVSTQASPPTVEISLNGQSRHVPEGATIAQLLAILGVERGRVAVERNLQVVPKKSYDEVTLSDGDRVEVVTFVGGG
jgi:thiamine biosynthesis protein ThiS